jgi:hypothetical protein
VSLPIPTDVPFAVGALLNSSLRLLWPQRAPLLRAIALPLAMILLLSLTHDSAPLEGEAEEASGQGRGTWPAALLVVFLNFYAIAVFSTAWYRFLLGYGEPRLWPGINAAQFRLLGRMLLIYLLPVLPLVLIGKTFVPTPLLAVASLALIYIALRWSLVLPAAAVGVPLTLRQSWRATAGNAVPLFLAPLFGCLVIGAVVAVPGLMVAGFFIESGEARPDSVAALILWLEFGLLALLSLAQAAAVLAMSVVRLVPDPQNA